MSSETSSETGARAVRGQRLLPLRCSVQHYAWGDPELLPDLLGIENPEDKPYAELWMGAHPDLPSTVEEHGEAIGLDRLIAEAPAALLGARTARDFGGELPYLFKIIAAAAPLSIQAHPSKQAAEAGFAREEAAGLPRTAPNRTYKDRNHKPELIAALTDFYGLRGFRPLEQIDRILRGHPELHALAERFEPSPEGLRAVYGHFMTLPEDEVHAILDPLVDRLRAERTERPFTREDPEYWVLRSDEIYSSEGHRDRGLLSILLLNLVHLRPGEAMQLPARVLHAYLEGAGVELMANSNNVLRGGLTPKHVDVPELLDNVIFEGAPPETVTAERSTGAPVWTYRSPAREFELRRVELDGERHAFGADHGPEIMVSVALDSGSPVSAIAGEQRVELGAGEASLAPAGLAYALESEGRATVYVAGVPATGGASSEADEGPTFRGRRPTALAFGTSGLRGLVTDITDLEAYVNARGFLEYLHRIGQVAAGDTICIAGDLRPSTDSDDRSILRAVARAIEGAGLVVENLGLIPTPALTYYALRHERASIMVTGSHIPFDRNGIKFNRRDGEVLKADEPGILAAVAETRAAEYGRAPEETLFGEDGMFRPGARPELPPVVGAAREEYLQRYLEFFPADGLRGKRIVMFQHSAVGRDLVVELLERLGAEVHPAGRSDEFVPIDTEDITDERLEQIQAMAETVSRTHGPVDAVVSTDGDSDRPFLVGIDGTGSVRFYGGDLVGIVVADYVGVDSIAVPISVNDAVDRHFADREVVIRKTKIGSPHVIAAMREAEAGHQSVVGWEANGGFLTGTAIERDGRRLEALPTRDAVLPILATLFAAIERGGSIVELFGQLPPRFSKAGLIDQFPQEASRAIVARFMPGDPAIVDIRYADSLVHLGLADGRTKHADAGQAAELQRMRKELELYFAAEAGFGNIVRVNTIDGIRVFFDNGDVAHIRPSGNAPQLRIYAVADTQRRAHEIVQLALREPDGVFRRLQAATGE